MTLNINLSHSTTMKAHNALQPRSGFAKWLRLCQCCWDTRIGFAGLRGTRCITQAASQTFWEFPTKPGLHLGLLTTWRFLPDHLSTPNTRPICSWFDVNPLLKQGAEFALKTDRFSKQIPHKPRVFGVGGGHDTAIVGHRANLYFSWLAT